MAVAWWNIEVQIDANINAWYGAILKDIVDESFVCRVQVSNLQVKTLRLQCNRVRLKSPTPSAADSQAFNPVNGEVVELEERSSEESVPCWRRVKVKLARLNFFVVTPTELVAGMSEVVVPKARLQPCRSDSLDTDSFHKLEIPVRQTLVPWLQTSDGIRAIERVEHVIRAMRKDAAYNTSSQLVPETVIIKIITSPGCSDNVSVRILGTKDLVRTAKLLVNVALNHQVQIHAWDQAKKVREQALENRAKSRRGQSVSSSCGAKIVREFETNARGASMIIGPQGIHKRELEEQHGVSIKVTNAKGNKEEDRRKVEITGLTQEDIDAVIDVTEPVEDTIDIEIEKVGWIAGRKFETMPEVTCTQCLQSCQLDRDCEPPCLRIFGSRSACRQVKLLFEAHMMYFDVFNTMDADMKRNFMESERANYDECESMSKEMMTGRSKGRDAMSQSKGSGKGWRAADNSRLSGKSKGRGKSKAPL